MGRNIGAFLLGLLVGNAWNMLLTVLNSKFIAPMPEGVDMMDPAAQE